MEKQSVKEEKIESKLNEVKEQLKDYEQNYIKGKQVDGKFDDKQIKKLQKKKTKLENKIAKLQTKKVIDNVVNVDFNIKENNIVYVGDIYVDGLTKTKDNTIRREILLRPGDVFSSGKVRRSMEKIYNLGFIDGAEQHIAPTGQPDIMNLAFSITEGKPGMITAGAGYSSVDKFVGLKKTIILLALAMTALSAYAQTYLIEALKPTEENRISIISSKVPKSL